MISLALTLAIAASRLIGVVTAVDLARLWNMPEPTWRHYDGGIITGDDSGAMASTFELTFRVSDMIDSSMFSVTYWDKDCSSGGNPVEGSGTGYEFRYDPSVLDNPNNNSNNNAGDDDGSGTKDVVLTFTVNENVRNQKQNNNDGGTGMWELDDRTNVMNVVRACVKAAVTTPGSPPAVVGTEVNFVEAQLMIRYTFEGGFSIDNVNVNAPESTDMNVDMGSILLAYDCSDEIGVNRKRKNKNDGNSSNKKKRQGNLLRVCVEPKPSAVRDGFRMSAIDQFSYRKTRSNGSVLEQDVVRGRRAAQNGLSRLKCVRGQARCFVETVLFGTFYTEPGFIKAAGSATFQFGSLDETGAAVTGDDYFEAGDNADGSDNVFEDENGGGNGNGNGNGGNGGGNGNGGGSLRALTTSSVGGHDNGKTQQQRQQQQHRQEQQRRLQERKLQQDELLGIDRRDAGGNLPESSTETFEFDMEVTDEGPITFVAGGRGTGTTENGDNNNNNGTPSWLLGGSGTTLSDNLHNVGATIGIVLLLSVNLVTLSILTRQLPQFEGKMCYL